MDIDQESECDEMQSADVGAIAAPTVERISDGFVERALIDLVSRAMAVGWGATEIHHAIGIWVAMKISNSGEYAEEAAGAMLLEMEDIVADHVRWRGGKQPMLRLAWYRDDAGPEPRAAQ